MLEQLTRMRKIEHDINNALFAQTDSSYGDGSVDRYFDLVKLRREIEAWRTINQAPNWQHCESQEAEDNFARKLTKAYKCLISPTTTARWSFTTTL